MVKYCENCGSEIGDESLFCPNCKTYVKRENTQKTSNVKWILVGVAVVILIIAAGIFLSNTTGKVPTTLTMVSGSNLGYNQQYKVLLTDNANNTLADKYITIEIDNTTYTIRTNSEGVASMNLTLSEGSHQINAYFKGDSSYGESHTSDIVVK